MMGVMGGIAKITLLVMIHHMVRDSKEFGIEAILARRKEIAAELERLRLEDDELETAIRVLHRFGKGSNGDATSKLGPARPENTPSLFVMTETVLHDAIAVGKMGLKGREIVSEIGKKYWPGVQARQVLPLIYSFVKKGRLRKEKDGIFKPI
jgi:hypothetical protein